jgi:NodT family efflux transporter outer membrane factor (OMF) lipoprotein
MNAPTPRRPDHAVAGTVLAAVLLVLLGGCVATPRGGPHERPLESRALALEGPAYAMPQDGWWHALGDPQLDALVATALARNPGLAGALARVRSAREQVEAVGSASAPQVGFEATETRVRLSENSIFPPPYGGGTWWDGRLGFNLGWTLDVWGRQAALVAQASRSADAVALDATGAELMLSGAVAQAYVDYARALEVRQIARRAQAQRRTLAELTARRVHAGLDSSVEAKIAEANLEQSAVDVEQSGLAVEVARHALAALTGASAAAPTTLGAPTLDFEHSLPVPAALPADLLARRADVRAARARIEAASAGRAAAHASFYPNVDLTAFVGLTAVGLDNLLQGDSHQWSVGPAVHLPVFDGGRLKAEYRRSAAEIDAAVASYNETVLRSVREAADQVSRLKSLETQLAAQRRSLDAAEQAYSFALQRYDAGLSNQITVLNAETQVLAARRQRVQLLAERSSARIALLVALGGHSFQES